MSLRVASVPLLLVLATSFPVAAAGPCSGGPQIRPGVTALAAAEGAPGRLYAGTSHGLYLSLDAGDSWTRAGAGLPCEGLAWIGKIVPDPRDADIVYVLLGPLGESFRQHPVYKSTDGGLSFQRASRGLRAGPGGRFFDLAISPSAPEVLYVVALYFDGSVVSLRLLRSLDGGGRWSASGLSLPDTISSVQVDPTDPRVLYAGATAAPEPLPYIPCGESSCGLFQSLDGGRTWSRPRLAPKEISRIVVDPNRSETLYAVANSRLLKSLDSGRVWQRILGGFVDVAAVDPARSRRLYAGARELDGGGELVGVILRSVDGGSQWLEAHRLQAGQSVAELVVDPDQTSRVYAATSADLLRSVDGGRSFQPIDIGQSP